MEKGESLKSSARVISVCLLLAPLLFLFPYVQTLSGFDIPEYLAAVKFTFIQSLLSAGLSVMLGFLGALGLVGQKHRKVLESIYLLPNFAPTLFVILACLQIFRPFPYGLVGIVFVHVALNVGFVATSLVDAIEAKLGGMCEVGMVLGVSRSKFLKRVTLPVLHQDLLLSFMMVFAISFSSFAVPLIVGGSAAKTIEVLIFEKATVSFDFSSAILIGLTQTAILFVFSLLIKPGYHKRVVFTHNISLIAWKWGALLPLFLTALVIFGNLSGLGAGIAELQKLNFLTRDIGRALAGTLAVGFGTGVLILLLLLLSALSWPHRLYEVFFKSFSMPSMALIGFAIFLIGPHRIADQTGWLALVKIAYAVGIVFVFSLYRIRWSSLLESLRSQEEAARVLGDSGWLTFRRVILPQVLPEAFRLAGLAAFWACGDFALSSMITGEDVTLALYIESLLGSYRFDAASVLIWVVLILGYVCYLTFWRLGHVYRQKSLS